MRIYFIRHGESVARKNGLIDQTSETPLSDQGQKQAKAVTNRLRGIKIDLIYSSTFLRAEQTAEIISKKIGVPVERWEQLVEASESTETFNALDGRAGKILEHLLCHHKNQTVLCVSHATMIEAIVAKMVFGSDLSFEIMAHIKKHFGTINTGVSIAEFNEKDGWSLLTFNGFGHL